MMAEEIMLKRSSREVVARDLVSSSIKLGLFDGEIKIMSIESDTHLLSCQRFVDENVDGF